MYNTTFSPSLPLSSSSSTPLSLTLLILQHTTMCWCGRRLVQCTQLQSSHMYTVRIRSIVAERLVAIDFEKESTNSLMRASFGAFTIWRHIDYTHIRSAFGVLCTPNGPKSNEPTGECKKTRKCRRNKRRKNKNNVQKLVDFRPWALMMTITPKSHCDRC